MVDGKAADRPLLDKINVALFYSAPSDEIGREILAEVAELQKHRDDLLYKVNRVRELAGSPPSGEDELAIRVREVLDDGF